MLNKQLAYTLFLLFSLLVLPLKAHAATFYIGNLKIEKKIKTLHDLKNSNVVKQSLDFSCGAAGLSTILNFYLDDPITEKEIIANLLKTVDLAKVKARKGFSLLDLKKFAELRGYKVTGYKMDMDFLNGLDSPVLVPIKFKNYRHFVIIRGVMGDRVFLADPAAGNMTMKISRFQNIWLEGIGLVIEKPGEERIKAVKLSIKQQEALFADYRNILNIMPQNVIRTAIFTDEYN